MKPKYYVTTWDMDKQKFTPQKGVRTGPYSLWGLRKAIKALRECGYSVHRRGNVWGGHDDNDFSVLIENLGGPHPGFPEPKTIPPVIAAMRANIQGASA